MMTNHREVFLDTNILVYANLALSPFHQQAVQKLQQLDSQGVELWISRQTLKEYLSVMTRRGDLTGEIPIESLVADIHFFQTRFRVAEDGRQVTEKLLTLIE